MAKILIAFESAEKLKYNYNSYSRRYGEDCSAAITSEKFLEFMSPNATKGKALLKLAKSIGVASENIACIGDSDNDMSMFEISGLRIAVANATSSILQAADVVVPSASDCGIVKAVSNLILG